MATSSSVSEISIEDYVSWERMPYIHYLLHFQNYTTSIKALINSGNKVKAMTLAYASKLSLNIQHTHVGAQKIDGTILKTFEIIFASF